MPLPVSETVRTTVADFRGPLCEVPFSCLRLIFTWPWDVYFRALPGMFMRMRRIAPGAVRNNHGLRWSISTVICTLPTRSACELDMVGKALDHQLWIHFQDLHLAGAI